MSTRLTIAYVIDPRFSGGTSSAVAAELAISVRFAKVSVHAVSSAMFKGEIASPQIQKSLNEHHLELIWDQETISADVVVVHNPSFLKTNRTLNISIVCKHLIVVAHENFHRPGGKESFDVSHCLGLLDRATLSLRKSIAPISPYNRLTISNWLSLHAQHRNWSVFQQDWFNICDFQTIPPVEFPNDRRGRHSRPGHEKFPSIQDMELLFPKQAVANVILGGEVFLQSRLNKPHWQVYPFNGINLREYFEMFDFMVYFTASTLRESFGRVLAESIAAGKVVISDPDTASIFDGAVIACTPADVDQIINDFVCHPAKYRKHVEQAQLKLEEFSSAAFQKKVLSKLEQNFGISG